MQGLVSFTLDCNMACDYCFEGNGNRRCIPDRAAINRAAQEGRDYVIRFIDELYAYNQERPTRVIWHGGEPMLIDPALYEEIMLDQAEKGHKVTWGMQTNGTLLTDAYAKLIERFSIGVGISVDGLREQHDRFRVLKSGKPTFDLIMRNLNRVSPARIGALITITNDNVYSLREIYDFYADRGWSFGFNALYPTPDSASSATLDAEVFAGKICDLFDYWIEDSEHNINITNFRNIISAMFFPERGVPLCNWSEECSRSFVAIDAQGNLFNCEHWIFDRKYSIGHISQGLEDAVKRNGMFKGRVERLADTACGKCEIFSLCHGGCPWCAMQVSGDMMAYDSTVCVGRKTLVRHIYDYVRTHAAGREIRFKYT